jgi:hypothetical protein
MPPIARGSKSASQDARFRPHRQDASSPFNPDVRRGSPWHNAWLDKHKNGESDNDPVRSGAERIMRKRFNQAKQ